jgi:hypothetical protein
MAPQGHSPAGRMQWAVEGRAREVRGEEENCGGGGERGRYGDGIGSVRAPRGGRAVAVLAVVAVVMA